MRALVDTVVTHRVVMLPTAALTTALTNLNREIDLG